MKRVVTLVIGTVVAAFLIAFIVANRTMVTLTLNPFQPDNAAFTYQAPFFIWLFGFLVLGVLLGGIVMWLNQHKYRKALRQSEDELITLRRDLALKSDSTKLTQN